MYQDPVAANEMSNQVDHRFVVVQTLHELLCVQQFLRDNKLPADDLTLSNTTMVIMREDESVVASGAVEWLGDTALLRSVAVANSLRGSGIGKKIVFELLQRAKQNKVQSIYLLTETAPDFFEKLGFVTVSREATPEVIRKTTEFAHVCPASARVMRITLS